MCVAIFQLDDQEQAKKALVAAHKKFEIKMREQFRESDIAQVFAEVKKFNFPVGVCKATNVDHALIVIRTSKATTGHKNHGGVFNKYCNADTWLGLYIDEFLVSSSKKAPKIASLTLVVKPAGLL